MTSNSFVHVKRLLAADRTKLKAHFLALPREDIRLRFGAVLPPEAIEQYVDNIDFDRDAVFGVFDDDLSIAGVAHLARNPGVAELGISVIASHRGKGIGSALFRRAHEHTRNQFIRALLMHCLAENEAMMHIARKSGMQIVTHPGEAQAVIALPPATASSITGELLEERVALFDFGLKSQVLAARNLFAPPRAQLDSK
jgi:RimJ/RimL family protein N-acetyltransferase